MTFGEKLRIFFRLHFLQCLWNYKGMQNLGCLFAIRPVLTRLYHGDDYIAAEKRQSQYFNTHPYFAPICVGVTAKFEEELKAGKFEKPEMIQVLKSRMSGPLAAVGDAFFWETLRPVIGSLACLCIYAYGPGTANAIVAIAALLMIYVIPVEWIRWIGFDWGYVHGLNVVDVLKKRDFHGSMRRIRNIGAVLIGLVAVIFLVDGDAGGVNLKETAVRCAVLALLIVATMKKFSPTLLLYLIVILGMVAGGLS